MSAALHDPVARRFRRDARGILREVRGPGGLGRQGQGRRDREGRRRHRRRREDGRARRPQGIHGPRPRRRAAQGRRRGRGLSRARRERARRGRHLARQGAPRGELGQAREGLRGQRARHRPDLQPGQGRLHGRSRRRRGVPAALAGRHPARPRRLAPDGHAAALHDPEDGSPPRQHRRVAPHRARGEPRRAALRARGQPRRGSGHRRRRQEHHRVRRLRRSRRHRRPAARHRHGLAPRQPPDRGRQYRPDGEGEDHQDQPRDAPHLARHQAAPRRSVGGHRRRAIRSTPSSRVASPTSPITAPSWSWSRGSRA